jgi:peptide/nickel transport system substrate-binding protein
MRKGMKWSDGEPLTSDDFLFMYEDWMLNADITPVVGQWFRPGGEVMKVDIVDEYHFRMTFAAPNPSFVLVNMAHRYGWWSYCFMPRHYLEQFHIKYNPEGANDLAVEAGFEFWYQWFSARANPDQNIDLPSTRGFIVTKDSPQQVMLQRNPYSFMVDTEGNQLPNVDQIMLDRVADRSLLDPKIVGGQYDYAGFQTSIQNYTTYQDAAEQGGYKLILWRSGKGSDVVYNVNMNWPEQMIRDVFSDVRFRRALSLAINREEINQIVYYGNGTPRQMTVIPDSRHFKPEYETAWADYDVDQANALLDEMGLAWSADQKTRLWPDGTPMVISWDIYESETPKGPITQLVKEYWAAIGVQIEYKSVTRTLLTQKILANQEAMSLWHGDETTDVLFLRRPKCFAPINGDESCWGVNWGLWYNTHGEQGEEPPQEIKDLYTWLDEYNTTDSDEPAAKVLASEAENV